MMTQFADNPERMMSSTEQCHLPGYLTLDCRMNILNVHALNQMIYLSESQKRLMLCLMNDIHCKRKIIKFVWHECHQRIRDNNYHQLVYQFRTTLARHGMPSDLLKTIPHRGLVLNIEALKSAVDDHSSEHRSEPPLQPTGKGARGIRRLFKGLMGLRRQADTRKCVKNAL